MGNGSKASSRSASYQLFKAKAKNRLDDLQSIFSDLQCARKENRLKDMTVLEEQIHQMLREWKAELNEQAGSLNSSELSSDMRRLLQLHEEDDDATSIPATSHCHKIQKVEGDIRDDGVGFHEGLYLNQVLSQYSVDRLDRSESVLFESLLHTVGDGLEGNHLTLQKQPTHDLCLSFAIAEDAHGLPETHILQNGMTPAPSAFLGPRCALWDCQRPAKGPGWFEDYCSNFHANVALNEGPPGMTPVMRPGGIDFKDGPLFASLSAKIHGKVVGIPVCEGAATTKSPWNAPELFDLFVLEGEVIREWLFFDKPRRAFESGNRKQRSLPDYSGRGWHESRKQVMKEFGGLKRSYYMDPQPSNQFEWHLYEYEMNNCDSIALYRLELKQVDGKKNTKAKVMTDPFPDLQYHIGKLTSDLSPDVKEDAKCKTRFVENNVGHAFSASNQLVQFNDDFGFGASAQYSYSLGDTNAFHGGQ